MYFVLIEIDTFEVIGLPLASPELVEEKIEKTLSDRGRMPEPAAFARVMRSMRSGVQAKGKWIFAEGGVLITVRRCGKGFGDA